jgi:hypothetical protein
MAALDFPSSPTNGQVYGAYTYDSTKGAWNVTPQTQASVTTSDTPPVNPVSGDQWFYTVDGTMFVYYSDGTSSQWVEQPKSIAGGYSYYRSPNFLINGGFDIWQRGTSSTTSSSMVADRWLHSWSAGTATVSRSTDVPVTTLQYSLSFASTSGTNPQIQNRIEAADATALVGQTVTYSIWAKSTVGTAGLSWSTRYPTTTADAWVSPTAGESGVFAASMTVGTWTRYSVTFTVPAVAVRGYSFLVFRNATTTSTTTLYAGAQLEVGTAVTSFRRNAPSIQAELAACQRYYYRLGAYGNSRSFITGQVFGTTLIGFFFLYQVPMRAEPVADFSAGSTFSSTTAGGGGTSAGNTISISSASVSGVQVNLGFSAGQSITAGNVAVLVFASTAFLGFNAEL